MDIKIEPPTLTGSDHEKLIQLERWVKNLCERLNIVFDMLSAEVKKK